MQLTLDSSSDWFAVQVWAGREHLCARHLEARGYTVFLPCYSDERRWSDRRKTVDKALFAGYVFCSVDKGVFEKIVTTPGVVRILSDADGPVPIAKAEIEAIQRVVDAGLRAEPWQYLRPGQLVRIGGGPLRDTEGIVLRVHNRHRLIISVSVLQRSVAVEIDPAWITIPPEERQCLAMSR